MWVTWTNSRSLSAICSILGRSHVYVNIPKLNKLFLNFEFFVLILMNTADVTGGKPIAV
jgi:hypothetical protein